MTQRVQLIRPDRFIEGQATPGMRREQAVATDGLWAGVAHTQPGAVSGWHHHGAHESTIFVLNGGLRMEFGPGGHHVLDAAPGDFLYIAPYAVHREGNPTDVVADIVLARAGLGEAVVNVGGPEPAG